jgi:hypothetical protein
MASTYSPSLRIELIGAGEQAGTWNTTTNTNLGTIIESSIAGYVSVSVTSANQAFTALDGAPDQARNAVIALTTTTTANFAVYAPPQEKTYIIWNNTAYTATIYNSTVLGNTTAAGQGIPIPAGKKLIVFSVGTDFYTIDSANLTGVLAVVNGGTGVTTSTGTGNTVLSTSPTLVTPILGTPTSGTLDNCTSNTETFGTSNTQLATTAFVQAALAALHPVGSIYTATVSTNPATLLGFGTWTAFGAGRVLIGDGGGFSAGATGGSADAVVVSHNHTASSSVSDPSHAHGPQAGQYVYTNAGGVDSAGGGGFISGGIRGTTTATASTGITVTTTNTAAGVSGTNANLQPYVVVYMWNRTA